MYVNSNLPIHPAPALIFPLVSVCLNGTDDLICKVEIETQM